MTSVVVHGADETAAALRRFEDDLDREIERANTKVADLVADEARATARGLGSTAARVSGSIVVVDQGESAVVELGGGYPEAAGAEFGANQYPQFQPWRGAGEDGGYFLYPAIRANEDQIDHEYTEALDGAMTRNGLT